MIIEVGKGVTLTHATIVDFFDRHVDDVGMQTLFEELASGMCGLMDATVTRCQDAAARQTQESAIMAQMRAMERRLSDKVTTATKNAEKNADMVPTHLSGAVADITSTLERVVGMPIERLESSVKNVEKGVEAVPAQLTGAIERAVVEPIARVEAAIRNVDKNVEGLPAHVTGAVTGVVSTVERVVVGTMEKVESTVRSVEKTVDCLPAQLNGAVINVVSTVERVVSGTMEKLTLDAISNSVSDSVRKWLAIELEVLKGGQSDAKKSVETLEARLKEALVTQLADPLTQRSQGLVEKLQDGFARLPHDVLQLWSTSDTNQEARERLHDKIHELRTRMDEGAASHTDQLKKALLTIGNVYDEVVDIVKCVGEQGGNAKKVDEFARILPGVVKDVVNDTIAHVQRDMSACAAVVETGQQRLATMERDVTKQGGILESLLKGNDLLAGKLDALTLQKAVAVTKDACDTGSKGRRGEQRLYDELCDRLTVRDGYDIEMVNGKPHQCDLCVRKLGYPEIRIESKAHGADTGEKVRAKEVTRFLCDLEKLNVHGMFVSLHSEIVGRGNVEMEQLPNGRFAVFLGKNEYDIDQIVDMIKMVYTLDRYTRRDENGGDVANGGVVLTQEVIARTQAVVANINERVKVAKAHLKDTLAILTDLSTDLIERALKGDGLESGQAKVHECAICGKACDTAKGLILHKSRVHGNSAAKQ